MSLRHKTLHQVFTDILDHACPNGSGVEDEQGYTSYYIETHCVAWHISAKKTLSGWIIRDVKSEDC